MFVQVKLCGELLVMKAVRLGPSVNIHPFGAESDPKESCWAEVIACIALPNKLIDQPAAVSAYWSRPGFPDP